MKLRSKSLQKRGCILRPPPDDPTGISAEDCTHATLRLTHHPKTEAPFSQEAEPCPMLIDS
jgi:hypothetical protein